MCLYPIKIKNKHYQENKSNGGVIPAPPVLKFDNELQANIYDLRVLEVNVPCGQCIECRKKKARDWQIRLLEEIKDINYPYFVTFTFSPLELKKLSIQTKLKECNAICAVALRRCLERYRKDHKKSIRHWFICELGHEGTERIHMHGLLLSDKPLDLERTEEEHFFKWKYWKYGNIYVGDYVSERTINYIVKYMTKIDTDHKGFVGQVLASPGIGKRWIEYAKQSGAYTFDSRAGIIDTYVTSNGGKIKLPTYYKNKLYSDKEKEENWRRFMDLQQQSIMGNTYSLKITNENTINAISDKADEINKFLGYGDSSGDWKKKPYNLTKQMLEQRARMEREKMIKKAERKKIIKDLEKRGINVKKFAKNLDN